MRLDGLDHELVRELPPREQAAVIQAYYHDLEVTKRTKVEKRDPEAVTIRFWAFGTTVAFCSLVFGVTSCQQNSERLLNERQKLAFQERLDMTQRGYTKIGDYMKCDSGTPVAALAQKKETE